uniref:Uncharacterized protein n=1 Tax=Candidatus Kentrum eta TaxID=2126337 RepID=A0A450VGJ3_9GAMM|nr:MAG: hypothetical protein BECKH772A_GA0070896_101537 [Candidatus Kentron sp. H]VFJ99254.1 MAG: hypothetical protein BECKH772B_GA0070898_101547 [Candidatus Kentron sp. H]VFK03939.1 MAG: hypothetical protein BECKH772C_GA0070978_101527 [Candidatus Kentron sp. H]
MAQNYDWHDTNDPIGMMYRTLAKTAQDLEQKIIEGNATETDRLNLDHAYQVLIPWWHFPMLNNSLRASGLSI